MTLQRQIDQLVTHRASEWLEVLKTGSERERAAFADWLAESPRHVAEILSLVALEKEVRAADLKSRFDLEALLAAQSSSVTELSPARAPAAADKERRSKVRKWAVALAAGAAIAVLAIVFLFGGLPSAQIYATTIGEQRSIELLDGSVVYLNAQSRLRVRFKEQARDIELLRGEALFKVAHDSRRPFRVHTRDVVVQAVGTEFNVYARTDGTTVSVLEGKVQVATTNGAAPAAGELTADNALKAGEAASIGVDGRIDRKAHVNVASAVAWRQRRLVFESASLEDVVVEFNRYNQSPQLRLEGVPPGSRHYSGEFEANDPESLAALLAREQDLAVERREGEIVIRIAGSR